MAFASSCGSGSENMQLPKVNKKPADEEIKRPQLSKEAYYDKVLGALVGSAIGDAMGAPTEMWYKDDIKKHYGWVDGFTTLMREGSAEGPWADNLPPGGTTDDTRWKYIMGNFLVENATKSELEARDFAQYLVNIYEAEKKALKNVDDFDPEPYENQLMRMSFLQEWAKVAKPYTENKLDAYTYALSKFYGGEMVCGGMLYAPMLGVFYDGEPEKAYLEAYKLGIFDIGYARDITGLTAAMTSAAMQANSHLSLIEKVNEQIDPHNYFNARLTGRMAFGNYRTAQSIVATAKTNKDENYREQMQKAFDLLAQKSQDMPFHAAEIHLINLAALLFSEGDFMKAMEFLVNYGRDNDTVGAVTGGILGALHGFKKLPQDLAKQSLKTNKEVVGIDLELLAQKIVSAKYLD